MKTQLKVIPSTKVNMGGIVLEQPLPNKQISDVNPYLLIHHWKETLPGGQRPQELGVGPHPHRGFSPISFVYAGELHHRDSFENDSVVSAGGTQWMFAGKGVTHSERPSAKFAEEGGLFEFIQIWLNVPAESKLKAPKYYALQQNETPSISVGHSSTLEVVSGRFNKTNGAISSHSPVNIYRIALKEGDEISVPLEDEFNSCFYVLDGLVTLENHEVKSMELAVLESHPAEIKIQAKKDTRVLFLSGQPINEKVSSYGPFVMNNQTEVMEAIRDAQMGKMGVLIEEF